MFIGLIISLILLVIVIIYITRPLFTSSPETFTEETSLHTMENEYRATLALIRELDIEIKQGGTKTQDLSEQRTMLVQKAAEILREIKQIDAPTST
ncbi:MAG: hypothetical protein KBD67_04745 [Anaerolineaceae bacterium]|nr:hypothetical protein [Anaerolineaceae bacterium]